ncbi:hypothetical protein HXX76_004475 [Chlamydomonas incerta]|uniref:Uncharacterized protein n=1 Tax=Chlamydomonas incerta TaxID=51695 RepID=A0A835TK87_CHLIN|nr:hypothetical protein HXX76_004475 [Chlamydomonas incerta]|eukprot:KAG2440370.1 hypothetical protein HXX76_004475 [Chlamydomonas incerta]
MHAHYEPVVSALLENLLKDAHERAEFCRKDAAEAAFDHRGRVESVWDDYLCTPNVTAAVAALRRHRDHAERQDRDMDLSFYAREVHHAAAAGYRNALAALEARSTPGGGGGGGSGGISGGPEPNLSQPASARLTLLLATAGGKPGSSLEQTLTLTEGCDSPGCALAPHAHAQVCARAEAACETLEAKVVAAAGGEITYSVRWAGPMYYYQLQAVVPLTRGAAPATVYGGYFASSVPLAV